MSWEKKWALMVLCAAGYLVGYNLLTSPDLPVPDWGTWIGAIGTVLTLIGTIWIATYQARRTRHIEVTTAHIIAAALAPRLAMQAAIVKAFDARLTFGNTADHPYQTARLEAAAFLESESLTVSVDELLALAPLGDNCANRLAHAISLLQSAKWEIRVQVEADSLRGRLKVAHAHHWCTLMREIADRLDVVCGQCEAIAKVHAKRPSAEELYG